MICLITLLLLPLFALAFVPYAYYPYPQHYYAVPVARYVEDTRVPARDSARQLTFNESAKVLR